MKESFVKNFKMPDIPKKQVWLGIIFVSLNLAFWSLLTYSLALRVTSSLFVSSVIILGLILAVVYSLLVLFARKHLTYFLYVFTGTLLFVLYGFYDFNFVGVLLFTSVLFLAHFRAQRFKNFIADFRPYYLSRKFLPLFFTALAIMISFVYNSFVLQYYVEEPQIPESVYSVVFAPVEYSLRFVAPGYETGMTVEEFQEVLINGFMARFLPGEMSGQFDSGALPDFFGEEAGSITVEEFSLAWINETIDNILTPYKSVLPALFVFGIFLTLRFVFLPFVWVSTGLFLLVIKVLLLYNIIVLKEVTTVKQVPVLE
ncbi:MAG: hypothetical protein WDZ40_01025 [Candidatus Spechtbacterales bacterium]